MSLWPVGKIGTKLLPDKTLTYLARYIHQTAITNSRILAAEGGKVTFRYKDSRESRWKTMTLEAAEFIRRFLQHVLPRGFHKVRYYGLLGPRNRCLLEQIRQELTDTGTLTFEWRFKNRVSHILLSLPPLPQRIPDLDHDASPQMEGAAVISLCTNLHNPLFRSTANDTIRVSLSHSCAKTLEPDLVSRSNAPILTRIRIRYDHMMHNIFDFFDLFLDFKEKIPHSSSQINTYDD